MKLPKKILLNALLFLTVFGLTAFAIFREQDLSSVYEAICLCNEWWLLPALLCVLLFICGEAFILWMLLKAYGIRRSINTCFLFSSVGFFFSCVTPSASGGQPMQAVCMRKENIPVGVSTVILMIVTITYKLVLVLVGAGIALFGRELLVVFDNMLPVFYLGLFLNVVCVAVMDSLLFFPRFTKNLLLRFFDLLHRLRIIRRRDPRARLEASMDTFHDAAVFIKQNRHLTVQVILITLLQRLCLFSVTWFVYRAFGLRGYGYFTVTVLTAMISVAVDMLPLPGGMGISEGLFLLLFDPVFGALLIPAMVLSRGVSYYSELILSAVFTLAAFSLLGRRYKRREELRG